MVSSARNLPGWEGSYPLGDRLSTALGCPVRIGNDVQVATDAEFSLGAGREFDSLLGVFWGTGVGGGIVLDKKPWLGRGSAGEIGHIVVKSGGRRCPCGRKGCMEAYAGRAAMEARARKLVEKGHETNLFEIMEERGNDRLKSGIWERALKHGDAHGRGASRRGGEGDRHRRRLGLQRARRRVRDPRRRARPPLRRDRS